LRDSSDVPKRSRFRTNEGAPGNYCGPKSRCGRLRVGNHRKARAQRDAGVVQEVFVANKLAARRLIRTGCQVAIKRGNCCWILPDE